MTIPDLHIEISKRLFERVYEILLYSLSLAY